MAQSNNELDIIEVSPDQIDHGARFPNLYRLFDLERSAEEEWQRLSMHAATEVLAAFEGVAWKTEKQAEWDAYVVEHGYQPQWSATSRESFYKWVQECAVRDGHPPRSRAEVQRLRNAAECFRIVESNTPARARAALPQTEDAWGPVYSFLKDGWRDQIVAAVERAIEIAEGEGQPVTRGIMSAAAKEIRKTDPQIRQWAEQPGQTVDPRGAHDHVVKALNDIKKRANDLRKQIGNNPKAWAEFLAGLAEIQ